jgi:uncharacterized protein
MKYKLSKYIHIIQNSEILNDNTIIYSTRTGISIEIKSKLYAKISEIKLDDIPNNILVKLIQMEVYVPDGTDELQEILTNNIEANVDKDKRVLSYTIQPSGNCQLGCHYCGQLHTNKTMNNDVLNQFYDRISKKCEELKDTIQTLHITWYGGEPLTGLSSLSGLSVKLIELAKKYKVFYSSKIITNGLNLKYTLFEKLVNDFRITDFQITIDGMKDFHDKRRMLKSGEDSFDIIVKNIQNIVQSELYRENKKVNINIRCNVDSENKDNVLDFIDFLKENEILPHASFYIAAIHDWGDNKATLKGISIQDFADLEIDVYFKLHEINCLTRKTIVPERTTFPCMVVSQTSEVFDAFGNVSTCWEVPYTPAYDNTKYYSGNITKEDNVSTKDAPMRNWFNEIPTNDSWCKSCKFLPLCGGACPKEWYHGTPACPSFKFNIDDRILLQRYLNENSEMV